MTPLWASLPLPIAELAATAYLWRRRRSYPALISYLAAEAGWHFVAALGTYSWAARYGQPARMSLRAWIVFEVFRVSCLHLTGKQRLRAILAALGASGALACSLHLSPLDAFLNFRQYFHIAMAVALWALNLGAWPRWQVVSRERTAYRWGACAWLSVLAVAGTVVPHGIWSAVLPYTETVWLNVSIGTYGALLATVAGLALGMGRQPHQRAATRTGDPWIRRTAVLAPLERAA